ncbi:MAG: hypothetical protein D6793_08010 [Thermoflexia bacterium]|nr:MAG: hypothetical protein D6793_08010 [Thermoflexia bacterium]
MPNSPVCVDASFLIRLMESDEAGLPVQLWRRWRAEGRFIVAPALIFYEIVNALCRYVVAGYLMAEQAEEALEALLALGIHFIRRATKPFTSEHCRLPTVSGCRLPTMPITWRLQSDRGPSSGRQTGGFFRL